MFKFILSLFMSLNLFGYHPFQPAQIQSNQVKQLTNSQHAKQKQRTENKSTQQTFAIQQGKTSKNNPNLQLAVISDTHVSTTSQSNEQKFQTAFQDLKKAAPNYDVLVVNGDLTDNGLPAEYDLFNSILNTNINQKASKFLVIGNHEWREKEADSSSNVTDSELTERFLEKENVPGLYYDEWIKGYHFIALGGEKSTATLSANGFTNTDGAYISDKQINWLQKTLANGSGNGKPIFVFLHQPIRGTVYGSEWGAGFQDQKILAILKKYPQVILFTGHSHYPLNNAKSIIHDGITMVNTSAVAYTYTPETGVNNTQSQGLVVNVYKNKVEFKEREFDTGSWIKTVTIPLTTST